MITKKVYFITGGAGFIGSHLVEAILNGGRNCRVIVYDNFSSGRLWHLEGQRGDRRLEIVKGDIKDMKKLSRSLKGARIAYHFASNPNIAMAVSKPDIDFWEGTFLTNNLLEAMRQNGVKKLIYASGSGVYGDTGLKKISEDCRFGPPISTYGASKAACEALISSYCHMFGMDAVALRFANVVGPCQTHGVGYDFIRKLMANPGRLKILGDGRQSKSYLHVSDCVNAMRLLERRMPKGFSFYNVATLDRISVDEIAAIVARALGLGAVKRFYTGGARGWKGDVPVVRLDSSRIRMLGWRNRYTSKEAMELSVKALYEEAKTEKSGARS